MDHLRQRNIGAPVWFRVMPPSADRLPILAALVVFRLASSEQAPSISEGQCTPMRARLDWLRTEAALLEAQIRDTCEPVQTGSEIVPNRPQPPSVQTGSTSPPTGIARRREGGPPSLPASQLNCSEMDVELIATQITGPLMWRVYS